MKNSWLIWVFIVAVIITVFIAFNYENGQKTDSLSEIFPEETQPVDIEYEFADKNSQVATPTVAQATVQAPVATTTATIAKAALETAPAPSAQTVTVAAAPQTTTASSPTDAAYTIQVASYGKESMAQDFADKLKAKSFESYVGSRTVNDKTYYRVYVGKYQTKSEAQTALSEVQKEYQTSFIISPKK